jgi:fused signal recognition particle receptor
MVFRALYDKLKQGLAKTREAFGGIAGLFGLGGGLDKTFLQKLEEKLYLADVGAATPKIIERVRQAFLDKEVGADTLAFVRNEIKMLLTDPDQAIRFAASGPTVILVAGVNGTGKTTTIAKLAHRFQAEGKRVMLAAGDTFRAAAIHQLTIWSERLNCPIIKGEPNAKSSGVVFDAVAAAVARGIDVLIVDTAGRLHTQGHLMRELETLPRIIQKQIPEAPHETLLVLDATTGQNAIQQAQQFKKVIRCTGIILTKLDGTAKGGAIIPIKQQVGLPVKFIGVGEQIDDLEVFDPEAYAEALFAE